ncbi:MFS transporter [Pseudolysinimonas sp.]|uniref:MFS transporter n=1 Tax=Pseudolysinimonas sp. TaxID=2680009 RepID=UPI00286BEE92|nr:MFS transporter [Pseudolysinimonas sp.]
MSIGGSDPALTAPIPIQPGRTSTRDIVAIFRVRNFKLLVTSIFFASIALWMTRIAVDWLVLELTGNLALVGLAVTLQFGPTLLLGAFAGVVADRFSRRAIVLLMQSVVFCGGATLAVLAILGAVELWHVYLVAAVSGVAGALEGPARSALIGQIVDAPRLRTAMSLNASAFHIGGLIGPAVSGILIGVVGSGWSIGAAALATLVSILAFSLFRSRDLSPVVRPAEGAGGVRVALRYIRSKPTILWPMVLIAFVATFGMTLPVLFTAAAGDRGFDTGSAGYGLYTSLAAVGAVAGAIASARRRSVRLRSIALLTGAYGVAILLAGVVPVYGVFLAGIVALGVLRLLFAIGAESMVQLSTNPSVRGRVMAIYLVLLMGGQAAGGVIIGWVAEVLGMTVAFVVAGGMPLLAAIVVAIILARRHQLTISVNLSDFRRVVRIVKRPRQPKSLSVPSQSSDSSTDSAP